MKRSILFAFGLACLALSWFDDSSRAETAVPSMPGMVGILVDAALELSEADDPLVRARICQRLADRMSREVQDSAKKGEVKRATSYGQYLELVLVEGVGETLRQAHQEVPANSPQSAEVELLSQQASSVAGSAEKSLETSAAQDQPAMKEAVLKIQEAKKETENRSQGKGKMPGWMKKGKKK